VSLDVLAWVFLASFIIHLIDETAINGGFIRWIQTSFWPTYTVHMNVWFNGAALLLIATGNVLYDLFGGHWIILVLLWPFGFALHGVTLHLFWSIRQWNLSPGLLSSVIYWIIAYFFVRYGFVAGEIGASDFWTGVALGVLTVGAFLTFAPTLLMPALTHSKTRVNYQSCL
jgi:hypothetical protein